MMLDWFNGREAAKLGVILADQFAPGSASPSAKPAAQSPLKRKTTAQELLQRADRDVRALRLNFYKRARFANSFKWRLIENGVEPGAANEVTQSLILHLAQNPAAPMQGHASSRRDARKARELLGMGNKCFERAAYAEAVDFYRQSLQLDSDEAAETLNNLGAALSKTGADVEAEQLFREAIAAQPDFGEAHCNLGNALRAKGEMVEAEYHIRRALNLNPSHTDAQLSLGFVHIFFGRLRQARACFEKVLKAAPRQTDALFGMGQIAKLEGRFEEAKKLYERVLELKPKQPNTWSVLVSLRKMTPADSQWLETANEVVASGLLPLEEADLRFAIGKYCDDVGDFKQAFKNYKRGNELLKTVAEPYDRKARTRFTDDLIRVYNRKSMAPVGGGGSDSSKPTFVLGMPRSGTSLAEQIIASHPDAAGAGELMFWTDTLRTRQAEVQQGTLREATKIKLAEDYLRELSIHSREALRVIDKTPRNSDYLGVIHSVFPKARIIYMRRDPIDTCLSCYFQRFSAGLNFKLDLSDLVHYYREHARLMKHWRAVLPAGTLLDVPYEDLVGDQETWTRKMLDFLELEWNDRCLSFHTTQRAVITASAWQVRQKIYKQSVQRWRNYENFIGPLRELRDAS
jgi:tetratricopeptide (TPR) repeat protein